jgi:hypothetical protein
MNTAISQADDSYAKKIALISMTIIRPTANCTIPAFSGSSPPATFHVQVETCIAAAVSRRDLALYTINQGAVF